MSKTTERLLQVGIIVITLVMIVCGVSVGAFAVSQWRNNSRLVDAQIKVEEAKAEAYRNPKPQVIEQRYYSPQDNK